MNKNRLPCNYDHKICKEIDEKGGVKGGSGIMIISKKDQKIYTLLGHEIWRNGYTISAGKRSGGNRCYVKTAERELMEEFKINLELNEYGGLIEDNEHFLDPSGNVRYLMINGSPIFVGIYDYDQIDIDKLNEQIKKDLYDEKLSKCYKEMSQLKWFDIKNIITIRKKNLKGEYITNYICDPVNEINKNHRIASFGYASIQKFIELFYFYVT